MCMRIKKKQTLVVKAAVNGLALMTKDDGEEANRSKAGDTLMNQFHIQFRLVHAAADFVLTTYCLMCKGICAHGKDCRKTLKSIILLDWN